MVTEAGILSSVIYSKLRGVRARIMYNLLLHLAQQNPVSFHENLVDLLQENRLKNDCKVTASVNAVLQLHLTHYCSTKVRWYPCLQRTVRISLIV